MSSSRTMSFGTQWCHNPGWMQSEARRNVLDQYTAHAETESCQELQSLQNAIIQVPMTVGTQQKKFSAIADALPPGHYKANGSMKRSASILRGNAHLGATLDNESDPWRVALHNLCGGRLNMTSNGLLFIILVDGGQ